MHSSVAIGIGAGFEVAADVVSVGGIATVRAGFARHTLEVVVDISGGCAVGGNDGSTVAVGILGVLGDTTCCIGGFDQAVLWVVFVGGHAP